MGHRPITGTACCLAARQTALTPPGTLTDPSGKSDLTVIRGWHFFKNNLPPRMYFRNYAHPIAWNNDFLNNGHDREKTAVS